MTMDQTQRTRDLLKQITRSSPDEIERWAKEDGFVALVLDKDAATSKNGQLTFLTAANLLLRLHPVVTRVVVVVEVDAPLLVDAPLFAGDSMAVALKAFHGALSPLVSLEITSDISRADECQFAICIGGFFHQRHCISVGSDGWNVSLSTVAPIPLGSTFNPIGSMTAACLAVSEGFKRVLAIKAESLGVPPGTLPSMQFFVGSYSFSTLTYVALNPQTPNPSLPDVLDVGEISMIGVGAGGGACLYALSTMPLSGTLWTVDPDVVNDPNLNRYLYATEHDARQLRKKVDVINEVLNHQHALQRRLFDLPFLEFKSQHPEWPKNLVLSTVDTAEARHAIQWETPRLVLDAAVSQSAVYVHRVELGRSACLKCTHPTSTEQPDIVRSIAGVVGLEVGEVNRLYFDNVPLSSDVARVVGENAVAHSLPAPTAGMTLKDWVTLHCGQMNLKAEADMVLPIPFATVLPGILLAGEIIKERCFPDHVVKDRVNHDLFGLPSGWLTTPLRPDPSCDLCGNQTVRAVYDRAYKEG